MVKLVTFALSAGLGATAFFLVLNGPVWGAGDEAYIWGIVGLPLGGVVGLVVSLVASRLLKPPSMARPVVGTLLLVLFLGAAGVLPIFVKRLSWDEEVALVDGRTMKVRRSATQDLEDFFGRPGRWRTSQQTIGFSNGSQQIGWEIKHAGHRMFALSPRVFDFVQDIPVVVFPIYGRESCERYGFPPEGLVAFAFRHGEWRRIAIAELPARLKVNLLGDERDIAYRQKTGASTVLSVAAKQLMETGSDPWPKQGQPLSELRKSYARIDDACARLLPPPDDPVDVRRREQISDAERGAPLVEASLLSMEMEQTTVTADVRSRGAGRWTGRGYLGASCRGIVDDIQPLRRRNAEGVRGAAIGHEVLLADAPAGTESIQIPDTQDGRLHSISCDPNSVFAVRVAPRPERQMLVIHRFTHAGEFIDAWRVFFPDADKVLPTSDRLPVWAVTPDGRGNLSVLLADEVRDSGSAPTFRRHAEYLVHMAAKVPASHPRGKARRR